MARRMLDSGMWSNENFAVLSAMARLLLIGVITLADDQGRCKANPAYLRSQIFPYEDISTDDINRWLGRMADNDTIVLYDSAGKAYLQLVNWWNYQPLDWAHPSEYPAPDGWKDRLRFNAKGNICLTYNWRTKSGTCPVDNCDSHGVPTQVPTIVPTQVPTEVRTQVTKLNLTKPNCTGDEAPTSDRGSDWRSVVDAYQQEIGVITPGVSEEIKAYYDEIGAAMLIDAFKEASRNNIRKWSYVDGILKKWKVNGRTAPRDSDGGWNQLNNNLPDYMKEG
jgi:DnaD/phage-associated family protein